MLLASLAPCRFPSRPCRWAVPESVMWVPEWFKGFDPKQVWDALSFVTAICWSHFPNSNCLPLSNMHFVAMLIECVFTFRSYEPVPCSLLGEAALLFSQWLQLEFSKEFKSNRGIRSETRQEFQFYPILIYAIPIYCKCIVAPAIQAAGQVGSK